MKNKTSQSKNRIHFRLDEPAPTRKQIYTARQEIRTKLGARENHLLIARAAMVVMGVIVYRVLDTQSAQFLLISLAGLFVSLGFIVQNLEQLTRSGVSRRNLHQRLRDFDRLEKNERKAAKELIETWPELRRYADSVRHAEGRALLYGELLMFMEYDHENHQKTCRLNLESRLVNAHG